MAFTFKQALEFNKLTLGLATAGLAYSGTIGSETVAKAESVKSTFCLDVRIISTLAVIVFAFSVLCGILVMGRASKISAKDDDRINDSLMKGLGAAHSATLVVGLFLAGILMLSKIWKWV